MGYTRKNLPAPVMEYISASDDALSTWLNELLEKGKHLWPSHQDHCEALLAISRFTEKAVQDGRIKTDGSEFKKFHEFYDHIADFAQKLANDMRAEALKQRKICARENAIHERRSKAAKKAARTRKLNRQNDNKNIKAA